MSKFKIIDKLGKILVIAFIVLTVGHMYSDKEIREPFRLAIHNDDGNLKNTYLIAHEFSKYLVDTPWGYAFYPILILPNLSVYANFDIVKKFTFMTYQEFGVYRNKDTLSFMISVGKRAESSNIDKTLYELAKDIEKSKAIFINMYPKDQEKLEDLSSVLDNAVKDYLKQLENDKKNTDFYLNIDDYRIIIAKDIVNITTISIFKNIETW